MIKTLVAFFLLLPAFSQAQLLEISLKGGIAPNNLTRDDYFTSKVEKPTSYYGSVSITAGLPFKIRVGASVSAYQLEYSAVIADLVPPGVSVPRTYYKYGNPVVPVELILIRRFDLPKISLDAGFTGGMSITRKVRYGNVGDSKVYERSGKDPWYTYGVLVAGQVNVTKRFALGAEAQAKWLRINTWGEDRVFLVPVMLKASVRI